MVGVLAELKPLLDQYYEKARQHPEIWIGSFILVAVILLILLPPWQVHSFEINNATSNATLENQYLMTLAQILGGVAVAVGIYFAWKNFRIAQENLKVSQEGQITERFTRAINQLENPKVEIRVDGIYALERILEEYDEDYWSIMEILTAYIRQHSLQDSENINPGIYKGIRNVNEQYGQILEIKHRYQVTSDIKAILNIIRRRKYTLSQEKPYGLDLRSTYLREAHLEEAHLENANFTNTFLLSSHLKKAHLADAIFAGANLIDADLREADLKKACFENAFLDHADFEGADLTGAIKLEIDQLFKVKTLRGATLDDDLRTQLDKTHSYLLR